MNIKLLPKQVRPREKILKLGSDKLTDSELLAIILGTGIRGKDVLHLSNDILRQCDGFAGLLSKNPQQLKTIKGLGGNAKRASLVAIIEIAKRSLQQTISTQNNFTSSTAVKQFCSLHLNNESKEVFAALFLDSQYQLIKFERLFSGTIDKAKIYPRELLRKALLNNSAAIIITHNHPSGNHMASPQDIETTKQLKLQLKAIDIKLLDHIIVGKNQCTSLAEEGLLNH